MIDIKQEIVAIVHRHLPGCKIFLYGSRARGTHAEGADFDIALDAGSRIPPEIFSSIESAIEDSDIYTNVDVVDLHRISESFLHAIKKDLVLWTK